MSQDLRIKFSTELDKAGEFGVFKKTNNHNVNKCDSNDLSRYDVIFIK